ncbi:Fc.00g018660.m01.CDS01 [Cosmosporella sp. VM-42]
MKSSLPLTVLFPTLTLAITRIFSNVGDSTCQSCLTDVESTCKGPITSDQFNDCFCAADGDAFAALEDCLKGDCGDWQYQLLSYYGAHCFAAKDDEESEFCVDASQDDEYKLSIADMYCSEFVTASGDSSTPATSTEASSSSTTSDTGSTTSDAATTSDKATTTPTQTSSSTIRTSIVPTGPMDQGGTGQGGDGNGGQDDSDNADNSTNTDGDDNAGSSLTSIGTIGAVVLAFWTSVMVIRVL